MERELFGNQTHIMASALASLKHKFNVVCKQNEELKEKMRRIERDSPIKIQTPSK